MDRVPAVVTSSNVVTKPVAPEVAAHVASRDVGAFTQAERDNATGAARASPCQNAAKRSSALITAVPSGPSASNISPLPLATPSMPPNPSRCAWPALITRPTVGSAIAARCAISRRWFAPISMTAQRCAASSRHSVSGTPMWLLRLPCVTRHGPSSARIAPVISLTVVLPLLPVMPTTTPANERRQAFANAARPASVSATTTCGSAQSTGRLTIAPAAPRFAASATKS